MCLPILPPMDIIHDANIIDPLTISEELNNQYCKSGDCEFDCTAGNSFFSRM